MLIYFLSLKEKLNKFERFQSKEMKEGECAAVLRQWMERFS